MSKFDCLNFEVRDHVAHLTLNRPEAANALNLQLAQELEEVSLRCAEDPDIRAVLLTGSGQTVLRRGRPQILCRAKPCRTARRI